MVSARPRKKYTYAPAKISQPYFLQKIELVAPLTLLNIASFKAKAAERMLKLNMDTLTHAVYITPFVQRPQPAGKIDTPFFLEKTWIWNSPTPYSNSCLLSWSSLTWCAPFRKTGLLNCIWLQATITWCVLKFSPIL